MTLSLYANHKSFTSLALRLDEAQQAALLDKSGQDEVVFGDTRFIVHPYGVREGSRTKGTWMRWKLQSQEGIIVLIKNSDKAHKTQPNVSVRASSRVLMAMGVSTFWGLVQYWLGHGRAFIEEVFLTGRIACRGMCSFVPYQNTAIVN